MAEFCLKCWNEMNGTNDPPSKFMISKDLDVCEGCGKLTHVILMERKFTNLHKFRFIVFPFKIVYAILFVLWKIFMLPYSIYNCKKKDHK